MSTHLRLPRSLSRRWPCRVSLALGHALFESLRALTEGYLVSSDEKRKLAEDWWKSMILLKGPGHSITDKGSPSSTSFRVLGEWLQQMRCRTTGYFVLLSSSVVVIQQNSGCSRVRVSPLPSLESWLVFMGPMVVLVLTSPLGLHSHSGHHSTVLSWDSDLVPSHTEAAAFFFF